MHDHKLILLMEKENMHYLLPTEERSALFNSFIYLFFAQKLSENNNSSVWMKIYNRNGFA